MLGRKAREAKLALEMLKFDCPSCGNSLFFNNQRCLRCDTEVNFSPRKLNFVVAEDSRECRNRTEHGVCNWQTSGADDLCPSCRKNEIIPDLSVEGNKDRWSALEEAKRRLLFSCLQLNLPLDGVSFKFLASTPDEPAMTGHADGLITINIDEACSASREAARQNMEEKYRTLVGHFRHEYGHYYWDQAVLTDPQRLARCRQLFGDERADYQASLKEHYAAKEGQTDESDESEAPPEHVSDYAQAHPWEDWAETFAHYLHMRDVLETAEEFGLAPRPVEAGFDFAHGLLEWQRLSVAFNEINRSMGHHDLYPFTISEAIAEKLEFVHQVITGGSPASQAPAPVPVTA